jgi:uncharacterized protein YggE
MIAKLVTCRIRATGQVGEFLPDVARAMLASGIAEEVGVPRSAHPESAMVQPAQERAVAQTAARARGRR